MTRGPYMAGIPESWLTPTAHPRPQLLRSALTQHMRLHQLLGCGPISLGNKAYSEKLFW